MKDMNNAKNSINGIYSTLFSNLKILENDYSVEVRPRSIKKYEEGKDRDILIRSSDKTVLGIYVAKNKFKFWTDLKGWDSVTSYECFDYDDKGYYKYYVDSISGCVDEVKKFWITQNKT